MVPAGLLLASWKRPEQARQFLSSVTKNAVQPKTWGLALKVLLAAGILYRLNRFLSRRALNNFVSDRSWDWKREIVLITGGSSGIGEAVVKQFADRNIKVVILDLSPPRSSLDNVVFYKVDVTSTQEIQEVAAKIRQEVGDPTVLINNAGIGTGKTILDETDDQIQRTFEVNILSHFKLVKEFLPYMVKHNHGHVVTVASMASFACAAGNVDYSATKAGAHAFHEGLASELRARYHAPKVRTTYVCWPPHREPSK
jgi:short-subunit dehydrogenase